MLKLVFDGEQFICHCSFFERAIPKDVGFRWSLEHQKWYTTNPGIARRLVEFADESAKKEINRILIQKSDWTAAIPHHPSLTPKPFQIKAARFALERNRSYLALDPGLGKTICAALIINALRQHQGPKTKVVYVCPPFLVANVSEELTKWCRIKNGSVDIFMLPDSMLNKTDKMPELFAFAKKGPSLLIVDEAHRYKNSTAQRTQALFKRIIPAFDRVVFLSGTPMPSRPIELFPVLSYCAPETINFMNQFEYGERYCGMFRGQWGYDYSGATNVQELAGKVIGPFMIRMRKKDVLPELPERIEELVFIDDLLPPKLAAMTSNILQAHSPEDLMKGRIGEEHVSTYRRLLGAAKVKAAAEYIRFILEQSDEAVLVFALHRDVIAELEIELKHFKPLVIHGSVNKDQRFLNAKEFQENPERRLLILNIQAGGIGFNLTKATRVVFVEFSWVPADNDQAIDRAHRIGQNEKVLAQYLVHRNSIDRSVMEVILKKKETTQHV